MLGDATQRLTALLAPSLGDDAALMALEVTQGGENASQAIDGEIWDLAELARETPAVRALLTDSAQGDALHSTRCFSGTALAPKDGISRDTLGASGQKRLWHWSAHSSHRSVSRPRS